MAWYVGASSGSQRALELGPFRTAGDALSHVEPFRRWAGKNTRDGFWAAFGLAHDRIRHRPGRLNDHYGLQLVRGWAQRRSTPT